MDSLMQENKETPGSSKLFWIVMVIGILIFGGLVAYFLSQPTPPSQEVKLQNAVREGAPEFEALKSRVLVLEQTNLGTQAQNAAGGIEMRLPAVVKNFSGKTLTGLEVVASVVDDNEKVIKEKTAIVIPTQVSPIDNNKSALVSVSIGGFSPKDNRANFKFRVTAIKVE
ncbi:MAG: hypothetical protein ABI954_10595 [Pyrinomonadaceae bacterium]